MEERIIFVLVICLAFAFMGVCVAAGDWHKEKTRADTLHDLLVKANEQNAALKASSAHNFDLLHQIQELTRQGKQ